MRPSSDLLSWDPQLMRGCHLHTLLLGILRSYCWSWPWWENFLSSFLPRERGRHSLQGSLTRRLEWKPKVPFRNGKVTDHVLRSCHRTPAWPRWGSVQGGRPSSTLWSCANSPTSVSSRFLLSTTRLIIIFPSQSYTRALKENQYKAPSPPAGSCKVHNHC